MGAEKDRPAKGTSLYLLDGAGTATWKKVANRLSLNGPGAKALIREVKHLDSTCVQRRGTISDAGPIAGNILYDPAGDTHKLLPAVARSCATRKWIVRFNTEDTDPDDNYCVKIPGILEEFMPQAGEVDGNLEASISIAAADDWTEGTWGDLSLDVTL
jgi:hypothetical protein